MSREAARGRYDPPARLSSRGCPTTTGANRRRRRGAPGHRRGPAAHGGYEGRGASTGSRGDQRTRHPLIIEAVPALVRWLAKRHDVTSHANRTDRNRAKAHGAHSSPRVHPVRATALVCRVRPSCAVEHGEPEHSKSASNTAHQAHPRTQKPPPEPADGGSSPLTCYHERLTNSVDVPGSQGPGLRKRVRSRSLGPHKTLLTTCAMWYRHAPEAPLIERRPSCRTTGPQAREAVSPSPFGCGWARSSRPH